MGIFGFLSKAGRDRRALASNVKRTVNKYAQSADRFKAFQALLDDGSPAAIYGLMRRFGMMYDKSIDDEQEKEWVFDALAEKGASTLPQIERYLKTAESISWPLRLLAKVASKPLELEMVAKILALHEPGYERDPTKKIQLLNHLAGLKEPGAAALAVPYLGDMDEGVRYAAAEASIRLGEEDIAREPLIAHFLSDTEESLRVRLQIAEGFAERGWLVAKGHRPAFDQKLPEQFTIDRDGRLKKKPEKAA
jgi:HEAT repeat protein